MAKRIFFAASAFILCAGMLFSNKALAQSRLKVITTLFPQYDFARAICRDKADVYLLIPPGVEPHEYEPKPSDIVKINQADVFIFTNPYMEPWAAGIVKGISPKRLMVINASKDVKFIKSAQGIVDPHVWLDLSNAKVMVKNIADALIAKDPKNAEFYQTNAEEYNKKLDGIDNRFRDELGRCRKGVFISAGHSTFGYFAKRYGLTYLCGYTGYSPDSEPTPRAVMELIRDAKKNGLKYVYYEELLSPKLAQTIAQEAGAGTLSLNGAHNVSKKDLDSGVTFLSIMEENLVNLKKGLECN